MLPCFPCPCKNPEMNKKPARLGNGRTCAHRRVDKRRAKTERKLWPPPRFCLIWGNDYNFSGTDLTIRKIVKQAQSIRIGRCLMLSAWLFLMDAVSGSGCIRPECPPVRLASAVVESPGHYWQAMMKLLKNFPALVRGSIIKNMVKLNFLHREKTDAH